MRVQVPLPAPTQLGIPRNRARPLVVVSPALPFAWHAWPTPLNLALALCTGARHPRVPVTAILTVQEVDKSFGTRRILAGASFALDEGERVAIVGPNGAGKSTILRMLVAASNEPVYAPDKGLITRRRGLSLEYVPQEPHLDPEATVDVVLREGLRVHAAALARLETLEASIASLSGSAMDAALEEQSTLHRSIESAGGWDRDHEIHVLRAALHLPPGEQLAGKLSGGERRRVALARALLAGPELLLLDEPTNHLDATTIDWLGAYLAARSGALLVVTHDRWFLDRVATRILELDRGRLYSYSGNYGEYVLRKAERLATESEHEQKRASFVRRELDWIRRGPAARSTKQQARIDRFDAAVASKPGLEDRLPGTLALRLPTGGRLGKTILELKKVGQSIGGRKLFSDLTLLMKPGDRIGIVGDNGAGKTTLIRTILGDLAPAEGEVVLGLNTKIAYLDQSRAELDDARTVLEEVAGDSDQVMLEDGPVHVRTFLRMMLFDDRFADTPIGTLSGGERNRVQLARLLRRGGNLLILDEPTNDLDLPTLTVLEEALIEFKGCALVVSHDRWFLDRVATAILSFTARPDGTSDVTLYEGSYSSYLARVLPKRTEPVDAPPRASQAASAPPREPRVKLTYKETQELAGMEAAIHVAEADVARRELELADPTLYKDRGAEVPALTAALDKARVAIEKLYARWTELEARR